MLRFVKYDLLQQVITEYCCGRAIFPNVKIEIPDLRLLIDQSFILNNIKKRKRDIEYHTEPYPIPNVCGKCDGYGFYDWVVHIRTVDGVDEDDLYGVGKEPIIVKNENPITTLFIDTRSDSKSIYIHYISLCIAVAPMSYRCDQCHGVGLVHDINRMSKLSAKDFLDWCDKDPELTIREKPIFKPKLSITTKIIKYLKSLYK